MAAPKTASLRALARDTAGKGALKFAFATCLIAVAVATTAPAFKTNPLISGTVGEIRSHLPRTFDTITEALKR